MAGRPCSIAWRASIPSPCVADEPFRMPVQLVLRAAGDFRGYAGTVTSGRIGVGERIVDARSAALAPRLRRIATMDGDLPSAGKGDAVTLVLDTDLDISRGAVLSELPRRPINADVIEARLVWLSETPFDPEMGYLSAPRPTSRQSPA